MENVRNRVNVYLTNNEKQKRRLVSKPHFKHATHFDDNFAAVHMGKIEVELNKPVYCGAPILDLSKCIMLGFHYDYAKKKWEKLKVLYTDTDSLIYEIETEDVFAGTAGDVEKWCDTSGYAKDHPAVEIGFPVGKNKKVPGVFKDECGGKIIAEFAGLRAKCYSVLMDEGNVSKRCKGVKNNVVKIEILHQDFKTTLFSGRKMICNQNLIRSRFHNVFTERMKKIALSDDDKRVVLENGIDTLALGHWRLS